MFANFVLIQSSNALLQFLRQAIRAEHKPHKLIARSRPLGINFLWLCRCLIVRVFQRKRIILIGLVDHFGDIVAAEPVTRYLRSRYPNDMLVWAVRPPYRELIESNPHVDCALVLGCLTEWMYLWRGLFSQVFDLHLQGRFCETCYCLYSRNSGNSEINLSNYYHHGNLLSVFCQAAGLPILQDAPQVYISEHHIQTVDRLDLPKTFIAIHCKSNQKERDWQTEKWQLLVEKISETYGLPVIEVGLRPEVANPPAGYRSVCGQLSLLETAEVIRRATLLIAIDSGPAHLANAVGTAGVIIMGHFSNYKQYLPYSGRYATRERAILLYADGAAATLEVDRVFEAVKQQLAAAVPAVEMLPPPPLVSIVVPTYKHRDFLPETLASIARQTFQDFEIIVVNDGSPDDTREVLRPWIAANKITYIEQENRGPGSARNRGLYQARGKYIAFLDDDDLWPPDSLETRVAALENHPNLVLVYGRFAFFSKAGEYSMSNQQKFPSGWVEREFLLRNWMQSLGQTLIRTATLQDLGGFDPGIWGSDDWEMTIRLAKRGEFQFCDRVTLYYRFHTHNASIRAAKHARNDFKVMRKHYRWNLPLSIRHLQLASRYFLPNLFQSARQNFAARNWGATLSALIHTIPFLTFNPLYVPQAIKERLQKASITYSHK